MELVPGETLRDLIARACPLPADLAVALIAQVTDALAYAHAQGLVHRDIKPANVLVARRGRRHGAGKGGGLRHRQSGGGGGRGPYCQRDRVGDPQVPGAGAGPGPRAATPAPTFIRSGVVLFEMLAGGPPFKGTTDMATALAHVQQPAPHLDDVRPGLPPGLGGLVDALLVKEPEKRVPSALVLGGALSAISRCLGVPAQSEPGAYLQIGPGAARQPRLRPQGSGR